MSMMHFTVEPSALDQVVAKNRRIRELEAQAQDLWAFVRKVDAYMDAMNNTHDISMETRLEAARELVEARSALRKYEP